jgi:hypothetical protein
VNWASVLEKPELLKRRQLNERFERIKRLEMARRARRRKK